MSSSVLFASVAFDRYDADATLPAKFERLLDETNLKNVVKDKLVCIKMHLGRNIGYSTIHPLFVKILVDKIKLYGGDVFITDHVVGNACDRGYTEQYLGCPIVLSCGVTGKYLYEKHVHYKSFMHVDVAGHIRDADVLIDLSHIKGHGSCGYGGAVKNISMGCVSDRTRGQIHALEGGISWNEDLCIHCGACVSNCNHDANRFDDEGKYHVNYHNCTFCQHCVKVCPTGAIRVMDDCYEDFQMGMALCAQKCLEDFAPGHVFYINILLNMTILCDCWGFTTPSMVPDVGILFSEDMVAIETASLDKIRNEDFILQSVPTGHAMRDEGHLLFRIHGKDPFIQLKKLEEIGMGTHEYTLREID